MMLARACSEEIVVMPLQPESSTAANKTAMDSEVNRALERIQKSSPKLVLSTITNIYERGIIDYLTRFAFDQSNPRKLWKTVRSAAIDQLRSVQPKNSSTTNQTFSLSLSSEIIFRN
jgi:hypothetical protein